jgi:hypothetical protein
MKNDNLQSNHPRGSSPPFQDPERDFFKWLNDLKSIGQRDERTSVGRITGRPEREERRTGDPDDGRGLQGREDETRWRDDVGKGGDAA